MTKPMLIVFALIVSLCHRRMEETYHVHERPKGRYPPTTYGLQSNVEEIMA